MSATPDTTPEDLNRDHLANMLRTKYPEPLKYHVTPEKHEDGPTPDLIVIESVLARFGDISVAYIIVNPCLARIDTSPYNRLLVIGVPSMADGHQVMADIKRYDPERIIIWSTGSVSVPLEPLGEPNQAAEPEVSKEEVKEAEDAAWKRHETRAIAHAASLLDHARTRINILERKLEIERARTSTLDLVARLVDGNRGGQMGLAETVSLEGQLHQAQMILQEIMGRRREGDRDEPDAIHGGEG